MRHPMFYTMTKLRTRFALRLEGYSRADVLAYMDGCSDDVVDVAMAQCAAEMPPMVGAFGDGAIIAAIVEFLKSEQGQALIKALIALLIGLI